MGGPPPPSDFAAQVTPEEHATYQLRLQYAPLKTEPAATGSTTSSMTLSQELNGDGLINPDGPSESTAPSMTFDPQLDFLPSDQVLQGDLDMLTQPFEFDAQNHPHPLPQTMNKGPALMAQMPKSHPSNLLSFHNVPLQSAPPAPSPGDWERGFGNSISQYQAALAPTQAILGTENAQIEIEQSHPTLFDSPVDSRPFAVSEKIAPEAFCILTEFKQQDNSSAKLDPWWEPILLHINNDTSALKAAFTEAIEKHHYLHLEGPGDMQADGAEVVISVKNGMGLRGGRGPRSVIKVDTRFIERIDVSWSGKGGLAITVVCDEEENSVSTEKSREDIENILSMIKQRRWEDHFVVKYRVDKLLL